MANSIRRLFIGSSLVLLAWVLACSEDSDPISGFELAPGILDSTQIRLSVIPTSDLDTFFQTTRSTGNVVWAGLQPETSGSTEAKTFLRFPAIAVPAAAVVTGASLILNADAGGDYGNTVEQDLEVERVTAASWFTSSGQGWPFDSHEPLSPVSVFTVGVCDTPNVRFTAPLPSSLVSSWVAHPDSNYGIALVARGAGGFKRFRAVRTVVGTAGSVVTLEEPAVEVRYTIDGEPDTLRLGVREHATLYSVSSEVESGTGGETYALIGGAPDFRAVIRFNLDSLSSLATLNRLRVSLALDPGRVEVGQTSPEVTIGAYEIASLPGEDLEPLPVVGFATTPFTEVTVAATDTAFSLDLARLGAKVENGVLLKVKQDYPSLVRLGFRTREAASGWPELEVTYTLPPPVRY